MRVWVRRHIISFRWSNYFTSCTILRQKARAQNVIHNLRRCSFMKKSPLYVTGNLVIVMQFISQNILKTSQNPRHAKAQGHVESLKLYSILWFDWSTSKQKAVKQGPWTTSPYQHCLGFSSLSAVRHLEFFMMVIYDDHSWTTKLNQGAVHVSVAKIQAFMNVYYITISGLFMWRYKQHSLFQAPYIKV